MDSKVSIVRCNGYEPALVQEAVRRAVDLIGGITKFISYGSKVLIKPNLLMAKEPEAGITTHPEVVRAVIRVLKEINCRIFLGDSPSAWEKWSDINEVYVKTGMKRISQEENVELVNFEKRRLRDKFPLTAWLDECDYLISIPKFKTHQLTILTGAIKNLYGLVSGIYKIKLHQRYFNDLDFANILVDIYQQVKPSLNIIDGIVAMESDGPATSGKLRKVGLILASSDAVALDSILTMIMGLKPLDILTTRIASERGLGIADINSIQICGEDLKNVLERPFKLPATSLKTRIPKLIIKIVSKFIHFYPKINKNNCVLCRTCVQICPANAIRIKDKRIIIDYSKCLSCFCCQESCPYSAIKVKKAFLVRFLGL
ncbi:MAG: DUF362 domain-containing protein [Candidatus Omnitrophica bacterium]|nr:DUF362 domain-containing protein [Candidatus Omnitrophota bacterium]